MNPTENLGDLGYWAVPVAVIGGAIRVSTPYLFVSLGECITEKSGRVNLGLEGTLFMGAVTAYGVSYLTHSLGVYTVGSETITTPWLTMIAPWLGVIAAGVVGMILGIMHALICNLPRVNFVAVGIAMMILGNGLACSLGKSLIQPVAPKLPAFKLGAWSSIEPVEFALRVNALFLIGIILAPLLGWAMRSTRWGMILRLAGESEEAASAMGYSVNWIRTWATALGGFLAGIAGAYLSLYNPGSWNEKISNGEGLMAVALVIFARWDPVRCLWASLLFGAVGSLGNALQAQHLTSAALSYLWNAAPYILTLVIMMITSSRTRALAGAPGMLTGMK
jgi:simple sugar transport system permease protein